MEDDSWLEFFTFPPDEDDTTENIEKSVEGLGEVGVEGSLDGRLGEGELAGQLDIMSAILPIDWTSSSFEPPATYFNPDTYDASLLFAPTDTVNMTAPATLTSQDDSLMQDPVTDMQGNDIYTDQMDFDLHSLPVIQTAENYALFGNYPSESQNDFPAFDCGGTNFNTDPLSVSSFEFTTASSTSQFPQLDFGFQIPVSTSNNPSLDPAPQHSQRFAVMNIGTAPRRR